jgi:Zn-dependent protease with chaperone function
MLALVALADLAHAQAFTRDMQKEARVREELAAISPGSVEAFKQATELIDKGEAKQAVPLFGEVMKKAPNWDVVNRRLGYSLVEAGQVKEGMTLLRRAVELNRSSDNLLSLAQGLAYPGRQAQGSRAEKQQALVLLKEAHRKNTDATDAGYVTLLAHLSLDLRDEQSFQEATGELVSRHQDLMATHYFNAVRAAMDAEWSTAEEEIRTAGRMGLSHNVVEEFLNSGIHRRVVAWRYAYFALYAVAVWAVGLALLFIIGGVLSKRTLHYLETADPNTLIGPEHEKLRAIYRRVINIAGLYYYISIPVVIFLIVAVTATIVYGFMVIGTIPIKLVLVLGIGALITIYQMIRSLFTRPLMEDPGRLLREDEAPGLWALSQEVARTVGTRPVSEIRVTPGTEVAVYERGSFRERMQDRAERVLVVGLGVLNGFRQNAFRAVLAHEYGHFTHRDTAGGDMALRVKADMMKFAQGMMQSGQNTRWNLGFHFLRMYFRIFTRISHGASRFQEALADRLASYHFGAKAFEEGLSHFVRRKIEFEFLATKEISEAFASQRAVLNLYELAGPEEAAHHQTLEEEFQKALQRETAETDTHPSPAERFRLISRIASRDEPAMEGMVWELFTSREALTREMSSLVEENVREAV